MNNGYSTTCLATIWNNEAWKNPCSLIYGRQLYVQFIKGKSRRVLFPFAYVTVAHKAKKGKIGVCGEIYSQALWNVCIGRIHIQRCAEFCNGLRSG